MNITIEHPKNQAFRESIKEMSSTYGTAYFTASFLKEAFDEVKDFSPKQIKNICYVVGTTCSVAPTIADFREVSSRLRERIREFEKAEERRTAHDFWSGTYHTSEVREIVSMISGRLTDEIKDPDWFQFVEMLNKTAEKAPPPRCKRCEDTGAYFTKDAKPYKCECGAGSKE